MIATLVVASAEVPTTVTKESETEFDVPKEIAAFVEFLVENHPETKTKYASMIAPFKEKYGGHFRADPFVAMEWLVPEFYKRIPESNYEGVYLVTSRMFGGFSHGYTIPYKVAAKVTVTEHNKYKAGVGDKFILARSKLTLHFDGFVEVTLTPK